MVGKSVKRARFCFRKMEYNKERNGKYLISQVGNFGNGLTGERSRQSEVCSFREVKWKLLVVAGGGRIPISFERFRATATDLAKCSRNSTRRSHSERPAGKSTAAFCHLNQLNISRC